MERYWRPFKLLHRFDFTFKPPLITTGFNIHLFQYNIRDSHSKFFYVPNGHTDGNDMCLEEILYAQVKIETLIVQKVFKISSQHEDHSLTFSKSFPLIPNMWHFDQYVDDFSQKIISELKTDYVPNGRTTSYIVFLFTK